MTTVLIVVLVAVAVYAALIVRLVASRTPDEVAAADEALAETDALIGQRLRELDQALQALAESSRPPAEGLTGRREVRGMTVPEFTDVNERFAEIVARLDNPQT